MVTAPSLLADLAAQAAAIGPPTDPPVEVLGPGVVDDTFAEGPIYYRALGGSLAANVGAPSARDGYVSRVHNQLQERGGRRYGLLNLGVTGETSGSPISGGPLEEGGEVPAATRGFLEPSTPFGRGTGIALEEGTSLMVTRLNGLAAAAAEAEGILVADGFPPMQGTAAFTTLM